MVSLEYTEEMMESQILNQMHKTKPIGNDFNFLKETEISETNEAKASNLVPLERTENNNYQLWYSKSLPFRQHQQEMPGTFKMESSKIITVLIIIE